MTTKTVFANAQTIKRDWFVVDATGVTLGRLASKIASRLRGKHKASFTPNADAGDHIIVLNAGKVVVTGNKAKDKIYYRHSEYPGGLIEIPFEKMQQTHPIRMIEIAVKGMLPKTPLGRQMIRKLNVYAGNEHPHQAQQPVVLDLNTEKV